jgi:hypothetical protein
MRSERTVRDANSESRLDRHREAIPELTSPTRPLTLTNHFYQVSDAEIPTKTPHHREEQGPMSKRHMFPFLAWCTRAKWSIARTYLCILIYLF